MFSGKTRKKYFRNKVEYKKLIHENLTCKYRKTPDDSINTVNNEAQSVLQDMKIKRKVEKCKVCQHLLL